MSLHCIAPIQNRGRTQRLSRPTVTKLMQTPKEISMKNSQSLPYRAALVSYQQQAEALFDELKSGNESAPWRFKWMHPRFVNKSTEDVSAGNAGSRRCPGGRFAHEYGFESWPALAEFPKPSQMALSVALLAGVGHRYRVTS